MSCQRKYEENVMSSDQIMLLMIFVPALILFSLGVWTLNELCNFLEGKS